MAAPVTSVVCSNQFQVVREFVVVAEVALEQPAASHPFVAAASRRGNPVVAPCRAVAVASVLADLAAMAVCPFRAAESAWVASDLVAVVDCCQPSRALTAECWAVCWSLAAVVAAASHPVAAACLPAAATACSYCSYLHHLDSTVAVPYQEVASSARLASSVAGDAPEPPSMHEVVVV